jgi:hypothetical protein
MLAGIGGMGGSPAINEGGSIVKEEQGGSIFKEGGDA